MSKLCDPRIFLTGDAKIFFTLLPQPASFCGKPDLVIIEQILIRSYWLVYIMSV
jgi:hypothetical protein